MDYQTVGSIISALLAAGYGTWKFTAKSKSNLLEKIQQWQDDQVKQERAWRLQAENERLMESRKCDDRIDELRNKYDALRDKHDLLAEKISEQRVQLHDLKGELGEWRKTARPGGKRYLDPKEPSK